jgi:hypothetical protein
VDSVALKFSAKQTTFSSPVSELQSLTAPEGVGSLDEVLHANTNKQTAENVSIVWFKLIFLNSFKFEKQNYGRTKIPRLDF